MWSNVLAAIVALIAVWFSTPTALPLSSTNAFPWTSREEPAYGMPSPPKWIIALFSACGPFSIVLFSTTSCPPFGRSML